MKKNSIKRSNPKGLLIILGTILLIAVVIGLISAYDRLRDIWAEQCVITSLEDQVRVNGCGKAIAEAITLEFGLTNGANVANIDFAAHRKAILEKIPGIRTLLVTRRMPRNVTIAIEERTAVARFETLTAKNRSGNVVDTEGVVFSRYYETKDLPAIREKTATVKPGQHITGRLLAALRLAEKLQEPGLSDLGLRDIDVSKPDFISAYIQPGEQTVQLKIAWDGMDTDTPSSRTALNTTLKNLVSAINARVATDVKVWNATDPSGRIYADTQKRTIK